MVWQFLMERGNDRRGQEEEKIDLAKVDGELWELKWPTSPFQGNLAKWPLAINPLLGTPLSEHFSRWSILVVVERLEMR